MKTDLFRRKVLGLGLASIGSTALGLLKPIIVFAADRNKAAFEAKDSGTALKALGADAGASSSDITVKIPDFADNGAVVPVTVSSSLPGADYIAIIVEKNPFPLVAEFEIANGAEAYVSTRIKMAQTSQVRAIVRAGGKTYTAAKEVKVAAGGCGG